MDVTQSPQEKLSRREVQYLKSLRIKKYRQEYGILLIEGKNLCEEALSSGKPIEMFIYDPTREQEFTALLHEARKQKITIKIAAHNVISQITETAAPQGIAACLRWKKNSAALEEMTKFNRLLVLDGISDPGNMGTLLRTAAWFGIQGILCGHNTAEITNPKVVRGSMGALFRLTIWEEIPLNEILPQLRDHGVALIGTDIKQSGKILNYDLAELHHIQRIALILGNETRGVDPEILNLCTHRIRVPGTGEIESLNVAVAGGILMYFISPFASF